MPSTPVTPRAVSMLWVILNGTFSGTRRLFPSDAQAHTRLLYEDNLHRNCLLSSLTYFRSTRFAQGHFGDLLRKSFRCAMKLNPLIHQARMQQGGATPSAFMLCVRVLV